MPDPSAATFPTVYLVEDDDDVRLSLTWLIESHGFTVCPFATPEGFLEQSVPESNVCIVLDLRLPTMSGLDVLSRLRHRKVHAPVILITGHGDAQAASDARSLGAFDFLEKPFDHAHFVRRLRDAIQTPPRDK